VGEGVLVGLDAPDDAAVYALDEARALVSTVDFFTPIVDDPYTFGAITAANALSDIYAMGGRPLFALNIVAFPINELDKSVLLEILRGGREKAGEAGVVIIGGHSIEDKEPKYGLAVVGTVSPGRIYRKSGGRPDDALILTKAIGTGIIATAGKRGAAPDDSLAAAVASMLALNARALELAAAVDVGAMTDVTGYGLVGHLADLARQSGVAAILQHAEVPLLPSGPGP
jgi:selenide,water dikinase